jgi:hypothetical protein
MFKICFGAVDQNNLEPETASQILDELQDWGQYIASDRELDRVLRSFANAAEFVSETSKSDQPKPKIAKRRSGPSL